MAMSIRDVKVHRVMWRSPGSSSKHEEIIHHLWLTQRRQGALPLMKLHLWIIMSEQGQTWATSAVSLYIEV